MLLWANDFRKVFWIAVIPGVLAVALLLFGVREPEQHQNGKHINPIRRENLTRLSAPYWWVVGIGEVFTLARFSEAFLVLRAQQSGIPVALVPLVMVAMNLIYAASATSALTEKPAILYPSSMIASIAGGSYSTVASRHQCGNIPLMLSTARTP